MITVGKHRYLSIVLVLVISLLMTLSCIRGNSVSFNEEIPPEGWSKFHKPIFIAEVTDTTTPSNILISIRNSYEYPFRNIFLFITTTSPTGVSIKDTIEYQLADEMGNWFGKGLGDIHNLSVPYKSNVIFPSPGKYEFKIEQGMRTDYLMGIIDVGLIIRTNEQ